MRDYVDQAIRRTRQEVGYPLKASPTDVQELARVLGDSLETGEETTLPRPPSVESPERTPKLFGEVLDAADRFSRTTFGDSIICDPLRFFVAARIVRDGFPVDTSIDCHSLLRERGRHHDILDADPFVELLRDPHVLLRHMHPDYSERLLKNAVDVIAATVSGPGTEGPSPNARSMRSRRPPHVLAMSPSVLSFFWRDPERS